jgi:hypothetical protein
VVVPNASKKELVSFSSYLAMKPRLFSVQMYTSHDGKITDLLRREATKDTANRYVTWLIDVLFKPEELVAIPPQNLPEDHRYEMLKGKFALISFNFQHGSGYFRSRCGTKQVSPATR